MKNIRIYAVVALLVLAALLSNSCTRGSAVVDDFVFEPYEFLYTAEENIIESDVELLFETTAKINDSLSDFTFQGIGYLEDENYKFQELIIINSETGQVINSFYLPNYTLFGELISGENLVIDFIDMNFDGYKDLRIFDRANGNWNLHYIYFLWDNDINAFVIDGQLGSLGLPRFDEEKQLIYSMARGSAADHWYYTHKYIDGVLTLIEEISNNAVRFENEINEKLAANIPILSEYQFWSFQLFIRYELNYDTLEMTAVERKYYLYIRNENELEWAFITEYEVDSEIGKQITEIGNINPYSRRY